MSSEFAVHRLNEWGLECAGEIARAFDDLLHRLEGPTCGELSNSRERSLVVTHLQQACFFAKRAMALQTQYQVEESK